MSERARTQRTLKIASGKLLERTRLLTAKTINLPFGGQKWMISDPAVPVDLVPGVTAAQREREGWNETHLLEETEAAAGATLWSECRNGPTLLSRRVQQMLATGALHGVDCTKRAPLHLKHNRGGGRDCPAGRRSLQPLAVRAERNFRERANGCAHLAVCWHTFATLLWHPFNDHWALKYIGGRSLARSPGKVPRAPTAGAESASAAENCWGSRRRRCCARMALAATTR